jgi:exonuclease SbcD
MRFLHTSDWHLGRSFHHVGLLDAQARYLDHLVETVRSEGVDAVLVSGDVYDRALPPPDAVTLLSETLARLVDTGAEVVLSSGNHDSAIRLGFAARLLERAGLHIRSSVAEVGAPVVVGGVAIHAIPYLEPSVAAGPLGTTDRSHAGVLTAAMERITSSHDWGRHPSVVMAHAFVTGGAPSDSERDISVGGVSAVHPATFDGVDYVALGHLHGHQDVGGGRRRDGSVRYSGSPVAMSFSEHRQRKVSLLVDLDDGDGPRVEPVAAPVERPLELLRGRLEDLLSDPGLDRAERAWCQVTLTDAVRPMAAMERLRTRFPHTLSLRFEPEGVPVDLRSYTARVRERTEIDVCCDFLAHVRSGRAATDEEQALLREAVESARLRRARRDGEGGFDRLTQQSPPAQDPVRSDADEGVA